MDVFRLLSGSPDEVIVIALAFSRVSALFAAAPIFRGRNLPLLVKMGLALLLVFLIAPALAPVQMPVGFVSLTFVVLKEVGLGLLMGSLIQLLFFTVQMAGHLLDTEMGFQMANILDPLSGEQLPLVGNFLGTLSLLVYFSLNGHLLLLRALGESFRLVPLGVMNFSFDPGFVIRAFTGMAALAVQMALPVIGVSLGVSLILGFMAKAVPQMNVFIVGAPLKVVLLSLLLVIVLPLFLLLLERSLGATFLQMADWLRAGYGG